MNSVRLFAWLGFAPLLLVACSEGAYSPNSGTPYLGNGMNQFGQVNPGIPQNGMMPGMNPLMNPMMDPFGMMGAQARLNGGFYFNGFWNMGCGMRRTTSYTPQQCACAQAPCDCQQQSQQCSGTINADSKTLPLTLTGADARALYQRLAREEVDTKNRDKTKVRTGTVIKCMKDGRGKKDKDYACDFDISVADGRVFEFYPVGKPGAAAQASDSAYSGTNLEIGGAQLNTNEAIVKLRGRIAAHLFKKMGMEAKPGNIAGNTAANIKNGMNLKCFETLATAEPITECQIKLRVETGEVISN
jgi:hypothetical protein